MQTSFFQSTYFKVTSMGLKNSINNIFLENIAFQSSHENCTSIQTGEFFFFLQLVLLSVESVFFSDRVEKLVVYFDLHASSLHF